MSIAGNEATQVKVIAGAYPAQRRMPVSTQKIKQALCWPASQSRDHPWRGGVTIGSAIDESPHMKKDSDIFFRLLRVFFTRKDA